MIADDNENLFHARRSQALRRQEALEAEIKRAIAVFETRNQEPPQ